jgi:hypothetical protein
MVKEKNFKEKKENLFSIIDTYILFLSPNTVAKKDTKTNHG